MKRVILLTRDRGRLAAADRTSSHPIRSTMIVAPRLRILAAIAAALATIALLGVASGNSALAASSLVNGNFETGDLSGWTVDTTASGGTASAVTRYDIPDPFIPPEYGCCSYLHVLPHEGSYFALLTVGDQSEYTTEYTTISQPFTASKGDRVSGWVFTLETLFQARPYTTPGFDDPGEVVLTDGSGTTVATLFEDSGSDYDYGGSPWKYWEHTFTDLPGEGQFQIQAKQSGQMWTYPPGYNVLGLDDVKISTLGPDTTKPSTSATRSVEPNAEGWNNTDVTVKLKATDNEGGWGLKELTYRINGGEPTTKQGDQVNLPIEVEVPITAEGENTLTYYATDKAGNVEDEKSVKVKIDKTPPKVDSFTPSPEGVTGVSPSTTVTASFSEAMDPTTLVTTPSDPANPYRGTSTTFTLVKDGSTTPLDAKVSVSSDGKEVTLQPSSKLAVKTKYKATVKGGANGAKDKAGNALASDKVWSFTTGTRQR